MFFPVVVDCTDFSALWDIPLNIQVKHNLLSTVHLVLSFYLSRDDYLLLCVTESLLWASSLIPMLTWHLIAHIPLYLGLQSKFLDGRAESWSSWNHLYWALYLKHSRNVWWKKKNWNTRLVSELNSWVLFPLVMKICFDSIFLSTFKKMLFHWCSVAVVVFVFCLHGFWWENLPSFESLLLFLMYYFSMAFSRFLTLFWFYPLIMMSKSMFSLSSFYLKFAEFRTSANTCPLPNLENFQPLFLQICFCTNFFSSSSRTIIIMYKNLWYCPTGLWDLFIFYQTFFSSVFSRLDNFYWLTFKLIGPFFFFSPPFCFWGL